MIKNLLFFLAFLLILSIITYCSHNIISTDDKIDPATEFDPTCTNGTASTEKVSVENTENCTVCTTKGYALTEVGDFMECRIPYICTNGVPAPANSDTMNTAIENCASCDVGYVLLPVFTDVESFRECPLDTDNDGTPDINDVDVDGDGLIEIHTLNDLAMIRYDLDGEGSDDDDTNTDMRTLGSTGCGGLNNVTACNGYELMRNLDFADNASYVGSEMNMSWRPLSTSIAESSSTIVSADDGQNAGWIPIGDSTNSFSATFEGNGFTIRNLYVRRSARVGFFGETSSSANIRNVGLVEYTIFGGAGADFVGGLVGYNGGIIIASYATGGADGGGGVDRVGGLVGYSGGGRRITVSYATGSVEGGDGNDYVGGLVGWSSSASSSIIASYARGDVVGGIGNDFVGGLVGNSNGNITASYATGKADGGDDDDYVGGLLGFNSGGRIIASYARGDADGGVGNDYVGGLVGYSDASGHITASYATGKADGGSSIDYVGSLVGYNGGRIIASYATGKADGGSSIDYVGGLVGYSGGGGRITVSYATGDVDGGAGADNVGGLVGKNLGRITASYARGDTNGGGSIDDVGGLVGYNGSSTLIRDSYGFGRDPVGETISSIGTPPAGITIFTLTRADANTIVNSVVGTGWDIAWDFGITTQPPALKYADYDGTSNSDDVEYCKLFLPLNITCGTTLLPGQGR